MKLIHAPRSNFIPGGSERPCARYGACFDAWAKYTARLTEENGGDAAGGCSPTCCGFEPEARS